MLAMINFLKVYPQLWINIIRALATPQHKHILKTNMHGNHYHNPSTKQETYELPIFNSKSFH